MASTAPQPIHSFSVPSSPVNLKPSSFKSHRTAQPQLNGLPVTPQRTLQTSRHQHRHSQPFFSLARPSFNSPATSALSSPYTPGTNTTTDSASSPALATPDSAANSLKKPRAIFGHASQNADLKEREKEQSLADIASNWRFRANENGIKVSSGKALQQQMEDEGVYGDDEASEMNDSGIISAADVLLPSAFLSTHRRSISDAPTTYASATHGQRQRQNQNQNLDRSAQTNNNSANTSMDFRPSRRTHTSVNYMQTPTSNRAIASQLKFKGSFTDPAQPRRREALGVIHTPNTNTTITAPHTTHITKHKTTSTANHLFNRSLAYTNYDEQDSLFDIDENDFEFDPPKQEYDYENGNGSLGYGFQDFQSKLQAAAADADDSFALYPRRPSVPVPMRDLNMNVNASAHAGTNGGLNLLNANGVYQGLTGLDAGAYTNHQLQQQQFHLPQQQLQFQHHHQQLQQPFSDPFVGRGIGIGIAQHQYQHQHLQQDAFGYNAQQQQQHFGLPLPSSFAASVPAPALPLNVTPQKASPSPSRSYFQSTPTSTASTTTAATTASPTSPTPNSKDCSVCLAPSPARLALLQPCNHPLCSACLTSALNIVGEKDMTCAVCKERVGDFKLVVSSSSSSGADEKNKEEEAEGEDDDKVEVVSMGGESVDVDVDEIISPFEFGLDFDEDDGMPIMMRASTPKVDQEQQRPLVVVKNEETTSAHGALYSAAPVSAESCVVLRIDNVPWDITPLQIAKWLSQPIVRIHVLLDPKGKTMSHAFVEVANAAVAGAILRGEVMQDEGAGRKKERGSVLGKGKRARGVTVTRCGQEELMRDLFPNWKGVFVGSRPSLAGLDNERVIAALAGGLVSKNELAGLLFLIREPDSHFLKVPSLPFHSLISLLAKFPADADSRVFWTSGVRDQMFEVTLCGIQQLFARVQAAAHNPKEEEYTMDLLYELGRTAMLCQVFTTLQIHKITEVLDACGVRFAAPQPLPSASASIGVCDGPYGQLAREFGVEPLLVEALAQRLAGAGLC